MCKSKLQELCHRKRWDLPVYSTAKHGLDHNPRFQATVTVHDQSFSSRELCMSSKQAQNDAARVAFEHFSSPPPPPPPSSSSVSGSSSGSTVQFHVRRTDQTTHVNTAISTAHDVYRSGDMEHLCKNQLQYYAQKKNLPLPIYSFEREGPPHASRFKCEVTVDEQTYESQHFFPTLRDAENAAAKVALMSLSLDKFQEDDSVLYKNILQELAQKEGYSLPVYYTKHSGESHIPTFISTVEVEGKVFTGQEAKSKKQAEMSAAKVAYMTFKECLGHPSRSPAFVSPAIKTQTDCSSSSLQSDLAQRQHLNIQPHGQMVFSPSSIPKGEAEEHKELTTVNAEVGGFDLSQFPQPALPSSSDLSVGTNDIPPNLVVDSISQSGGINAPPSSLPSECSFNPDVDSTGQSVTTNAPPYSRSSGCSSNSATDSIGQSVGTKVPTHRVIRVRPIVANMKVPEGSSVLQSDSKWIALEDRS